MITQTINLNLIPGSPQPRINVSQYDNGSRTLQFNLYNGISPYEIPSGASVSIVGTKADNTGFEYACTFSGSLVSVDITDQMTVFAGEVQSELQIRQSDEVLGTANFIINVESAALSDDTQISETDIPIIQRIPEILEEAEGYADDAKHWAEQSETAVTGAVTYGYNGIMGAKNLLTFPYYEKTITRSGVTFTVNDDGTVTADGTATENCVFLLANYRNYDGNETALNKIVETSSGKFRLTGCPSGGSADTYYLQIGGGAEGHITWWGGGSDTGNGRTFDANIDGNKFYIYICRIVVVEGCVCDNLVFKPMLRDYNDVDETFRPYAMTNRELTTPTFTQASTRANINSGETISTIMSKIKKFFADLKTVAFTGKASDVSYTNTTSGLSATNVQSAIDETNSETVRSRESANESSADDIVKPGVYIINPQITSSGLPTSGRYGYLTVLTTNAENNKQDILQRFELVGVDDSVIYERKLSFDSYTSSYIWYPWKTFLPSEQVIANHEVAYTASQAYSVGSYLTRGEQLKKVTSAIASGESITGNNTSNTTVGEELRQLNSDLSVFSKMKSESQADCSADWVQIGKVVTVYFGTLKTIATFVNLPLPYQGTSTGATIPVTFRRSSDGAHLQGYFGSAGGNAVLSCPTNELCYATLSYVTV